MNKKKKTKKEELQSLAYIIIFFLLLIPIGMLVLNMSNKEETQQVVENSINHNILAYSEDNKLAIYNTKDNKYTDNKSIAENTTIKTDSNLENPYNIIPYESNSILVTSPNSNEIISYKYSDEKLNEQIKIKTQYAPNKIALQDKNIAISYMDSKQVDILNLDTKKIEKTFNVDEVVDSIEIDEKQVYIANGNNIEIIPLSNEKDRYTIFTGAKTISLCKSSDGFLYAGNTFASDSKNSLLLKIDLENKNVANILELNKENPISITESEDNLFVLCKGLQDKTMDGISIVDRTLFTGKSKIATGDSPNYLTITSDNFIYVSHDNGQICSIDLNSDNQKTSTFTISGVKSIYTLPTK